jgi:hypothetical protein
MRSTASTLRAGTATASTSNPNLNP